MLNIVFSHQLGIPYGEVLCKNRYVGRTFIQPSMRLRKLGVAKKFGLLTGNFQNKRVVIIDDSIVRGNTMKPIIQMLKNAGALEVMFSTSWTLLKQFVLNVVIIVLQTCLNTQLYLY